MTASARLLIRGGLVVDPEAGTAERLDLLIDGGRIQTVSAPGTIIAPGIPEFDAADRLVLPGLVNAHTHGHANLMKGVADRWTLEASLTNGPWLGGARDPETIYLSTLLGAVDMLSKGCTACYDLVYEFPRPTVEGFAAVARAYADAGIRAVLAPMVADKNLFQAIPGLLDALPVDLRERVERFGLGGGDETIAAIEAIIAARDSLPDGISLAIAPTIPHHCSERFLMQCVGLAERHGLPIHMHIAESRLQALTARRLWGKSPVAYLADHGVLRPGFTAAHSVWLDDDDLDLLADKGCSVAHIPASNFRLGSGIASVRPMLDRGITVGLATDGANSSDALSMLQAMRLASFGARAYAGPRTDWLSAVETVRLATVGSADIVGLDQGGRIRAGALADLAFFDLDHLDFIPLTDAFNQLVSAADSASITDVMVGGRFVVTDGKVVSVDISDLPARVRAAVERLGAALGDARALAARLEPHVVAFAEGLSDEPIGMERFVRREARGTS
ncbi:amidohydrolase family protein [Kaistia dalseonensis]|uniref:Cytosine/adenosine deaminase-related metal-dependent hydrolase n=1 Tax=Kaistia dalseonensis TaxID=410840 RepID=A0ABU0H662_9HYPH|nr:amidohydrolase family protein [Kaistia dalseonensis]MCX5494364.1 amidohydrolase family protein [Kaistia dalseonensis]MDQ0436946.1 cytosine/adenosine deaminase-related metal-dependent hydrolase [Kaistia dalseonensis]